MDSGDAGTGETNSMSRNSQLSILCAGLAATILVANAYGQTPTSQQPGPKIGFVNLNKVLDGWDVVQNFEDEVQGRIEKTQKEINEFDKRDKLVTHKVYFPTDPPLRVGDLITITVATPDILGQVLKFLVFADRSAGLGLLFGVMCELEKNPRYAEFLPAVTT